MKKGTRLTPKQKREKVEKICKLYATDEYSIDDCCRSVSVARNTFYGWLRKDEQLAQMFEKAKKEAEQVYFVRLKTKARRGLEKRISGFEVEESKGYFRRNSDGELEQVRHVVTKKYIPPSDTAIIFALTNNDPENFKHKQHIEHAPAGGKYDFSHLTDEQLEELEQQLEKAYERKGSRAVDS